MRQESGAAPAPSVPPAADDAPESAAMVVSAADSLQAASLEADKVDDAAGSSDKARILHAQSGPFSTINNSQIL